MHFLWYEIFCSITIATDFKSHRNQITHFILTVRILQDLSLLVY